VLARYGLAQASRFGAQRWSQETGLDACVAARMSSAFELGRQVERCEAGTRTRLTCASDVARLMQPELRGRLRESFYALVLDASQRLVVVERVSEGTLSSAPVHPREVFLPAIRAAGASLIVVHNHPSGDPEPSTEDIEVTRRLIRAGALLGVPLVDHVVLGEGCWVSLRKRIRFE
jgi:DNA repair protein RadC